MRRLGRLPNLSRIFKEASPEVRLTPNIAESELGQTRLITTRNVHSTKRTVCADNEQRHRKKIMKTHSFMSVSKLDISALTVLGPRLSSVVTVTDNVCTNSYRYFQFRLFSRHEVEEDRDYVPQEEVVAQMKECISSVDIDVTLLRKPDRLKRSIYSYAARKETEVDEVFSKTIRRKISDAYNLNNTKLTS